MKEEWKVFIRGVEGRGDEVIKVLIDLGGKNPFFCEGSNPKALYYIGHDGNIHFDNDNTEHGLIIMDDYKEIGQTEKWKPSVGDRCWMVASNGRVNMFLWFNTKTNRKLLDFGNCFHTKEKANIAAKKIKKLLKGE